MKNFVRQIGERSHRASARLLFSTFLSLTACGSLPAPATAAPAESPALRVAFRDGQVTARGHATSLRQFMTELGKVSGATVRWLHPGGDKAVSVDCTDLPISEALRKILGTENFLLFYASAKGSPKLTEIWISSGSAGGESQIATPQLTAPVPPGTEAETAAEQEAAYLQEEAVQAAIEQHGHPAVEEAQMQADAAAAMVVPPSTPDPSLSGTEPDAALEAMGQSTMEQEITE